MIPRTRQKWGLCINVEATFKIEVSADTNLICEVDRFKFDFGCRFWQTKLKRAILTKIYNIREIADDKERV
jgi:hypothetical protein